MAKTLERRDQCCLCGKTKEHVRKLIVGLHGAVCADCIGLCCDILHVPFPKDESSPLQHETFEVKPADAYTLEIPTQLANTFPDPMTVLELLAILAPTVELRAQRISLERDVEGETAPIEH
jgi:hypothetical protein